jgi:hypothetical protein
MNIIELLVLVGFLAAAYFAGQYLAGVFGSAGWVFGVLAVAGLYIAAFVGLRAGLRKWERHHPRRPICENGNCTSDEYTLVRAERDGILIFECRCGLKYRHQGSRFMRFENGTPRSYMRRAGGRWQADDSDPAS